MTSTILRVKRLLDESPHEGILLHCKRQKRNSAPDIEPSLFIFSGTVSDQEYNSNFDRIASHSPKNSANGKRVRNVSSILNKLRDNRVKQTEKSRFQILNYNRGISITSKEDSKNEHQITLLDLERQPDESTTEDIQSKYAYDLYLATKDNAHDNDVILDEIVRIDSLDAELVYTGPLKGDDENASSIDSDDSNGENNYRNEYPDTPDGSIGEDEMVAAFENCALGNDLSSDDGEEFYVYDEALCTGTSKLTLNTDDIERFGLGYAKYKAKLSASDHPVEPAQNRLTSNFVYCIDPDENSNHSGYKSESDDDFCYGKDDNIDREGRAKKRDISDNDSS